MRGLRNGKLSIISIVFRPTTSPIVQRLRPSETSTSVINVPNVVNDDPYLFTYRGGPRFTTIGPIVIPLWGNFGCRKHNISWWIFSFSFVSWSFHWRVTQYCPSMLPVWLASRRQIKREQSIGRLSKFTLHSNSSWFVTYIHKYLYYTWNV